MPGVSEFRSPVTHLQNTSRETERDPRDGREYRQSSVTGCSDTLDLSAGHVCFSARYLKQESELSLYVTLPAVCGVGNLTTTCGGGSMK